MKSINNTCLAQTAGESNLPKGVAILDPTTLCKLKHQIAKEVYDNLTSVNLDTSYMPTFPLLQKIGKNVNNSAVAKYLCNENRENMQRLRSNLPNLDYTNDSDYLHGLNSKISDLTAQINECKMHLPLPKYDIRIPNKEQLINYYNISESDLDCANKQHYLIERLTNFIKEIKTKWYILLEYIPDNLLDLDEAKQLYDKFDTYGTILNETINVDREDVSYFADLFHFISVENINTLFDNYKLLWSELIDQLTQPNKNSLLDIIEGVPYDTLETMPIKDKFTTDQLMHNADVLNVDLSRFALTDISKMSQSELIDLMMQCQIKIKKNQAIFKELQIRRENQKIMIINKVIRLIDAPKHARPIYDLYADLFDFILEYDVIVHKWNLLNSIQANQLYNGPDLSQLQYELVQVTHERAAYIEYKSLQELDREYTKLIEYYSEIEQSSFNRILDKLGPELSIAAIPQTALVSSVPDYTELLMRLLDGQTTIREELANIVQRQCNAEPVSIAEPTPQIEAEPVPTAEPTSQIEAEPVPTAEPTPQIETEPVPTAELTPQMDTGPVPIAEPTLQIEDEPAPTAEPTPQIETEPVPTSVSPYLAQIISTNLVSEYNHNSPEYITKRVSSTTYYCQACDKEIKYSTTKPAKHITTLGHTKKYAAWEKNRNKLILA